MRLIREPKHVDFSNNSEPWTQQELPDFRKIIKVIKKKNTKGKKKTACVTTASTNCQVHY